MGAMHVNTLGNAIACPCKGCEPPTRHVGCHGNCQPYMNYRNQISSVRKKRQNDSMIRTFDVARVWHNL